MAAEWCDICFKVLPEPTPSKCPHCGASLLTAEDRLRRPEPVPPLIVTTTPTLPGYHIVQVKDVIAAEYVFGMNIFRDLFAGEGVKSLVDK